MIDVAAASELVTQSSAAAGAGGGAVGVLTGAAGAVWVARFFFKRMVDGYDQAISRLERRLEERDDKIAALDKQVAIVAALADERTSRIKEAEGQAAVLAERVKLLDRSAGIAHRRIEALAAGETEIQKIMAPDRRLKPR